MKLLVARVSSDAAELDGSEEVLYLRDMTPNEQAVLWFILESASFNGVKELMAQIPSTRVAGGCPTFLDLEAHKGARGAALDDGPVPIRAFVEDMDGQPSGEILIWVKDGHLSGLEYAWYTDAPPSEMPKIDSIRIH